MPTSAIAPRYHGSKQFPGTLGFLWAESDQEDRSFTLGFLWAESDQEIVIDAGFAMIAALANDEPLRPVVEQQAVKLQYPHPLLPRKYRENFAEASGPHGGKAVCFRFFRRLTAEIT